MVDSKTLIVISIWLLQSLVVFTTLIAVNICLILVLKSTPIPIEMIVIFSLIAGGIVAIGVSKE